jgi:RIO-like serine/threonine protein kinase
MDPTYLRTQLETSLLVWDRNVSRWRRNNLPEVRFINKIERTIYYTFAPLINKWAHVPDIVRIIEKAMRVLNIVARSGVNVPFPVDYSEHMHAVFDNVIEVYLEIFHIPLKRKIAQYINESIH